MKDLKCASFLLTWFDNCDLVTCRDWSAWSTTRYSSVFISLNLFNKLVIVCLQRFGKCVWCKSVKCKMYNKKKSNVLVCLSMWNPQETLVGVAHITKTRYKLAIVFKDIDLSWSTRIGYCSDRFVPYLKIYIFISKEKCLIIASSNNKKYSQIFQKVFVESWNNHSDTFYCIYRVFTLLGRKLNCQ